MVTREQIEDFARQIAERYKPEKIILFGSQARGTATEDSDVDLLIVMEFEGSPASIRYDIWQHLYSNLPIQLVIRRPSDISMRLKYRDFFVQDILSDGIVLFEGASLALS
jgi:uncharacterized protein